MFTNLSHQFTVIRSLKVFSVFKSILNLANWCLIQDEPAYPYLRALLNFDSREFLNVLAMVRVNNLLLFYF